jgi:ankyrin repeat protein
MTITSSRGERAKLMALMSRNRAKRLIRAAQLGNVKQLKSLLESGIDPDSVEERGSPPLHWATQEGHTETVELLSEAGANVNREDASGFTPLMVAVGLGHLAVVRRLIACGANVNQRCAAHKGGTPLHSACAANRLRIAKELISAGARVNAVDLAGRTPLYFAVMYGHKKIIKLLIDAGATVDFDTRDSEEHKTILELAAETNSPTIIELMKSAKRPSRKKKGPTSDGHMR